MNVVWLLYKLRMIANHAQGLKPGSLWVLYAALEGPLFHGDARPLGFLRPCFPSHPFFRSSGACSTVSLAYPRLAPWAAFFRRFAAGSSPHQRTGVSAPGHVFRVHHAPGLKPGSLSGVLRGP